MHYQIFLYLQLQLMLYNIQILSNRIWKEKRTSYQNVRYRWWWRAKPITSHASNAPMVAARYLHQTMQHWRASYTVNPILLNFSRRKEAITILSSLHQWSVQQQPFQKLKFQLVWLNYFLLFWGCIFSCITLLYVVVLWAGKFSSSLIVMLVFTFFMQCESHNWKMKFPLAAFSS